MTFVQPAFSHMYICILLSFALSLSLSHSFLFLALSLLICVQMQMGTLLMISRVVGFGRKEKGRFRVLGDQNLQ